MTILYYCDEYPPYRNGGIGTVVKLVAEELVQRGHKVVVAGKYAGQGEAVSKEKLNGVAVYRFQSGAYKSFYKVLLNGLNFLFTRLKICRLSRQIEYLKAKADYRKSEKLLAQLIEKENVDLIEMPDYVDDFLHGLNRPIRFKKFTVPLIIRVHGAVSFLEYYATGKLRKKVADLDKAHFTRADAVCAVSQFSKLFVNEKIGYDKEIKVIYNPIEANLFCNSKHRNEGNIVLFFGKIIETKGAFSLIQAFNLIGDEFPDIELKLIGSGDVERAKSMVKPSLAEQVHFVGFQPKSEIINEIDKSLFCVLPSYFENFSMASLEVLARGKALIYTERASGKELIEEGENGLLVNPEDVNQLAEKIKYLIEKPDKRDEIAENGFRSCRERFSTNVIIPELERYYEEMIRTFNS